MDEGEGVASDRGARLAPAGDKGVLQGGHGASEIGPPQAARNGHNQNPHRQQLARPLRPGHAAGGHNETLAQSDDDKKAVALGKVAGLDIPIGRPAAARGGQNIEYDGQTPQPVLGCTPQQTAGQDGQQPAHR